jgi:small subunit ribosomal protein S1
VNLGSGIEGFMPGSLVDVRYIPDFQTFLGQELSFKIIELNRERDKVILSRKKLLEVEAEEQKQKTISALEENAIINGVVKRLTDFGAFVDVGGIDGLVHISEVSWQRVGHPQEVLSVGEEIKVKVLEVIPERERISLSVRQAQPDPWSQISEKFSEGDIVKGKVTRIVNFGAFVELMPGVEGLVHISQMADFHVKHPSEIIQEGEEVDAKILEINTQGKRISLSVKEARPAPRDFSSHSNQPAESDNQGVTLGDVFGDLFNHEDYTNSQDEEK